MMVSQQISPRAARTRSALMEAGLELLVARTIDAIAIDEFVAVAGVGKGSFFNHFVDKKAFGAAVADAIRGEIEARVAAFNAKSDDPIERLLGGMLAAAAYAIEEPKRAGVLARAALGMTATEYPLNEGVVADVRAALEEGLLRPEAERVGVLLWLSCCQAVMASLVTGQPSVPNAEALVRDMAVVGLSGLGVVPDRLALALERLTLPPHHPVPEHEEFP